MKKLSQIINEAKQGLNIQEDTVNYLSEKDLKAYVEKAQKFLSQDAIYVIGWLMANNKTYVKDFTASKDSTGNALADFYAAGAPKDSELKELYKKLGSLNKNGQLLQVPVFQTKGQVNEIITGKSSPDEVFLDLTSEAGRNKIAKKYEALVWKIARSFNGKSSFTLDELFSIGLEGLTWAMNNYGKSASETQKKKKDDPTEDEDDEMNALLKQEKEAARKQYTFLSYAGYMIRVAILEAIKNESHLVRVPVSRQNKERKETGKNTKSMSVSGDAAVGKDKDGNAKSLFDTISGTEEGGRDLDSEDIEKLWAQAKKLLSRKFSEKQLGIFYDFNGLFGHEKMPGKEVLKKYGMRNPSEITANNFKITSYMYKNETLNKILTEIYTLYKECRNEDPNDDNLYNPVYLNEKMNNFVNKCLEEQNRFVLENDTEG